MKIQTGLRIPEDKYEKLAAIAQESGVSLNQLLLLLIDVGMKAVNLGIQEERRDFLHNLEDKDE